jgi:uncharacterized membrane protein YgdD (TMEM256/DUF423 family)
METFLVLGATFGLIGVALGAFGSHALRSKLPPGYFRASSFSCCAAAMILSARCDGTSS